jgi:MFS transporter, MHS family, proline/betaine transporter
MAFDRRLVALASLGGALEGYDFLLYGLFAAPIASAFFSARDPVVSLSNAFLAFAAGNLARPIGGIILGHFGDRFGRRAVFLWSMLVISLATIAMGLMPDYATAGFGATIAFVVLRIVQGLCHGGDTAGSVTYTVEAAPERRGFAAALSFGIGLLGLVAATAVNALLHAILSPEVAARYAWRIAFVSGGVVGIIFFLARRALVESPAFERSKPGDVHRVPLLVLLREFWPQMIVGFGLVVFVAALNGLIFGYLPAYLSRVLTYNPASVAGAVSLGVLALALLIVVVGHISDAFPRVWLYRSGAILFALGSIPLFAAVASGHVNLAVFFLALGACASLTHGTFAPLVADLFPTRVRFSGIAVCYNVAIAIFQGFTPFFVTLLLREFKTFSGAPGLWAAGAAAISLLASLWVNRLGGELVRRGDLPVANPEVRTA